MPSFSTRIPAFKKRKKKPVRWNDFKRGLNLLSRTTELRNDELSQADNILLTGSGVPIGRWGTSVYFTAGATGSVRGIGTYKGTGSDTTNEIFVLTDQGFLQKKDGTSSTVITGQSWPSGSTIRTEQLGKSTYIVSENVEFTAYDGTNLSVFATISPPTGLSATNYSGASGTNQISYKVSAIGSNGGTTTPSTNYVLNNVPFELSETQIHLSWTAPSAATLSGYEIYRGRAGDETYLSSVGPETTFYVDTGSAASEIIVAPITNTTGGVKSKFIVKYKDRLITVDKDDPNKLLASGRYPNHTKFNWADGGGYAYIDPDSGDDITGITVQPIADRLVVYKNYSSFLVELKTVTIGNFVVLDPVYQPISTSAGCSSQGSIQTVENDTFYFGKDGLHVTGYEPNFLNIIRTNEISARLRPFIDTLSDDDFKTCTSMYADNKYILSFPIKKKMLVYDRERGSFAGIWNTPYGISHMLRYFDSNGNESWVLGSYADNKVYRFIKSLNTDSGTTILKTMRTGKNDFGDWSLLNIVEFFYIQFGSVTGTTTINIIGEDRNGNLSNVKTFTITGSEVAGKTGWGMNQWGTSQWGKSVGSYVTQTTEVTRWGSLFKQLRLVQVEVTSSANNSNFELLGIKMTSTPQTEGALPGSQRV